VWSQADRHGKGVVGGLVCTRCTRPTIAKIEAGDRSVRVNEALGIADVFEMSLDALLGRREPDDTTLMFALRTLSGYAGDAKRQIVQVRGVVTDIEERREYAERRFDSPHIEALLGLAHEMAEHIDAAQTRAQQIDSLTSQALTAARDEIQR